MGYLDFEGQCTFERKEGESITSAEHYTCRCPGCGTVEKGKVNGRSIREIAQHHQWILLPQIRGKDVAYCSVQCARKEQPAMVARHVEGLVSQGKDIFHELEIWTNERTALRGSEEPAEARSAQS